MPIIRAQHRKAFVKTTPHEKRLRTAILVEIRDVLKIIVFIKLIIQIDEATITC